MAQPVGGHPAGAGDAVLEGEVDGAGRVGVGVGEGEEGGRGGGDRAGGGGAVGPAQALVGLGDGVFGEGVLLAQAGDVLVQRGEALLGEVGQGQPGLGGGAAVRLVAAAGRGDGAQGGQLGDPGLVVVDPGAHGVGLLAGPEQGAEQLGGLLGGAQFGGVLHPGLRDAPASGGHPGPEGGGVQPHRQPGQPHRPVRRNLAARPAAAERPGGVHHHLVQYRLHACPSRPVAMGWPSLPRP
ncbi:hypothetical protein GCM10020229_38480 [Kitasatospora albolonga]